MKLHGDNANLLSRLDNENNKLADLTEKIKSLK